MNDTKKVHYKFMKNDKPIENYTKKKYYTQTIGAEMLLKMSVFKPFFPPEHYPFSKEHLNSNEKVYFYTFLLVNYNCSYSFKLGTYTYVQES